MRRFLIVGTCVTLAVNLLFALPHVLDFVTGILPDGLFTRVARRALTFPSESGEGAYPLRSVVRCLVYAAVVMLVGGGVARWARIGNSRLGWMVCCSLAGAPAGVVAVFSWSLFDASAPQPWYLKYAAWWGLLTAFLCALITVILRRPDFPPGELAVGRFRPRTWVLPCVVVAWAVLFQLVPRVNDEFSLAGVLSGLPQWLPFDPGMGNPSALVSLLAVVSGVFAAVAVERGLRDDFPTEGRPGRAFLIAWVALFAAVVAYAALTAVTNGALDAMKANLFSPAWVLEYIEDIGAVLVAYPNQIAVPSALLALAAVGGQALLSGIAPRPAIARDVVRPDRRWSALVATAAMVMTYVSMAIMSQVSGPIKARTAALSAVPLNTWRGLTGNGYALWAFPDEAERVQLVWYWAIAVAILVFSGVVVFAVVHGQVAHFAPARPLVAIMGALALATMLGYTAGSWVAFRLVDDFSVDAPLSRFSAAYAIAGTLIAALVTVGTHLRMSARRFRDVAAPEPSADDASDEDPSDEGLPDEGLSGEGLSGEGLSGEDLSDEAAHRSSEVASDVAEPAVRDPEPDRASLDAEADQAIEELQARYRAWKEMAGAHKPGAWERRIAGLKAAAVAIVVAAVAGALHASARGTSIATARIPNDRFFLVFPELRLAPLDRETLVEVLTTMIYAVVLACLISFALRTVNIAERRIATIVTIWGLSVLAGGVTILLRAAIESIVQSAPAGLGPADLLDAYLPAGPQLGLIVGLPVALLVIAPWERVPRAGVVIPSVLAVAIAAAVLPGLLPSGHGSRFTIRTAMWRQEYRDPQLTVDVAYPMVEGATGPLRDRINGALVEPIKQMVAESLRTAGNVSLESNPDGPPTNAIRASFVQVRGDERMISVLYTIQVDNVTYRSVERVRAVNVTLDTGRALPPEQVFTPFARSTRGQARLRLVIRGYIPSAAQTDAGVLGNVDVSHDQLAINVGADSIHFTFGQGYVCNACTPFTAVVPAGRLAGLLRDLP